MQVKVFKLISKYTPFSTVPVQILAVVKSIATTNGKTN